MHYDRNCIHTVVLLNQSLSRRALEEVNERTYNMTDEKIISHSPPSGTAEKSRRISAADIFWSAAGLLLELSGSALSPAPTGAALAAGLSGRRGICVIAGGVVGAVLHGFPAAFQGLISLALVFLLRLLPESGSAKARAAVQAAGAGVAVIASRLTEASSTAALLHILLAGVAAAIFALCVSVLSEGIKIRGFDVCDMRECALVCVISAMTFLAVGSIGFLGVNIGRILLGFTLLIISSHRGLATAAVIGLSGVLGLCGSSAEVGAGGAIFAFAAIAAMALTRYSVFVRMLGYVFVSVTAALITGIGEGTWQILAEAAVSGTVFAVIPQKKAKISESGFAETSVTDMLAQRLFFAADAISAIETGLQSAADTLERKYKVSLEDIPERAADRCCRSCPNSMQCWGKSYDLFCKEFSRLTDVLRSGGKDSGSYSMSDECAAVCLDPEGVLEAVSAEYSRYVSVKNGERRVRDLRRIYTDQLEGVADILRDMGGAKEGGADFSRYQAAEKRAEKALRGAGVQSPQAFVMTDNHGRLRFEAYGETEPSVTCDYLGAVLSRSIGRELGEVQLWGSSGRYKLTAPERTAYSVKVGAFQISKGQNRVCGDCYEYFTSSSGVLYVIMSDGMGSGSRARVDSTMTCSMLSKLLKCGISLKTALEIVNTAVMVKSSDESYSTLDICQLDLNSGEGVIYKAGAAITYIKTKDRLMRASLSSSPVGLGGQLSVPAQKFTVGTGDVIIMMTDGAEADELWLSRELSQKVDPQRLSEQIARAARMDRTKDDDISVVTLLLEQ